MKKKHLLIMLVCCLVPVAAIVALKVFNVPLGSLGTFALLLLCPLGHLLMMSMGHKDHNHGSPAPVPVSKDTKD